MNYIETALIISLASLGFRAITGKNMILYFLRQPFDKISDKINKAKLNKDVLSSKILDSQKKIKFYIDNDSQQTVVNKERRNLEDLLVEHGQLGKMKKYKVLLYLAKPVILCSTCMASIHTLVWFPILKGGGEAWEVILVMLIVATLNTFIWKLIEKI